MSGTMDSGQAGHWGEPRPLRRAPLHKLRPAAVPSRFPFIIFPVRARFRTHGHAGQLGSTVERWRRLLRTFASSSALDQPILRLGV
ncbi:hypothetical protein MRX96_000630 [Rhipicephalus microplus]